MKKAFCAAVCAAILCAALCACSGSDVTAVPDGAETIEGMFMCEILPAGYYFSKDGFGQQYIGDSVYQIKYYIIGDKLTVENFSIEGGDTTVFDYEYCKTYILIGGLKYNLVKNTDISGEPEKTIDNG